MSEFIYDPESPFAPYYAVANATNLVTPDHQIRHTYLATELVRSSARILELVDRAPEITLPVLVREPLGPYATEFEQITLSALISCIRRNDISGEIKQLEATEEIHKKDRFLKYLSPYWLASRHMSRTDIKDRQKVVKRYEKAEIAFLNAVLPNA